MRYPIGMMLTGAVALGLAACAPEGTPVDAGDLDPPAVQADEVVAEEDVVTEMPTQEAQDAAAAAAQAEAEAGVVYVGEDKKGTEVSVSEGQTLRLELESIPTAGYSWQILEKPDFLELTGEGSRPTNPALQNQPGFVGGNHYQSFDLKASAAGTGVIKLKESQPWDETTPANDTFEVTVTVTAAQ